MLQYFHFGNIHPPENLNEPLIQQALTGQLDYRFEAGTIGGAEAKGRFRPTQEDRMLFHRLDADEMAHFQTPEETLKGAFAVLNAQLTQTPTADGSTGIVSFVAQNTLTVCNLGDSEVYILGLDANNEVVHAPERINTLHNPTTEAEIKRIQTTGNTVVNQRLGGILAVSRAFGDLRFEKYGLSHESETFTFDLSQNSKVTQWVIITTCDGLTDTQAITPELMTLLIETNAAESPGKIAQALVNKALEKSTDNISAIVATITKASLQDEHFKPFLMAVFDGHGGSETSSFLYANFVKAIRVALGFEEHLAEQIPEDKTPVLFPSTPILTPEEPKIPKKRPTFKLKGLLQFGLSFSMLFLTSTVLALYLLPNVFLFSSLSTLATLTSSLLIGLSLGCFAYAYQFKREKDAFANERSAEATHNRENILEILGEAISRVKQQRTPHMTAQFDLEQTKLEQDKSASENEAKAAQTSRPMLKRTKATFLQ